MTLVTTGDWLFTSLGFITLVHIRKFTFRWAKLGRSGAQWEEDEVEELVPPYIRILLFQSI